jgi:hypothetical protein
MTRVINEKKYYGQHVALESFSSRKVITHGKSLVDVYNRAKKKGIKDPVLVYIMDPKIIHIF